jgi:hypothetical protein
MTELQFPSDDSIAGVQPLLFRVADRMRLEGYVSALVQDNMSLSLVSGFDAILDHYGKLLVARLREAAPHIGLEVCFPASAEALITRFNEVLQDYSIEDAMGAKFHNAPPKIWIVHDAGALPDNEIQLLARLVQHFPGANIRVVMLFNASSQKQKLLAAFGRRILSWEIEPPTAEQSELLMDQARAQGREGVVGALLRQIGPQKKPPLHPMAMPDLVAEPPPAAAPSEPKPAVATQEEASETAAAKPARKLWLWAGLAAVLLSACGFGVAVMYGVIPTGDKAVQELRDLLRGNIGHTPPAESAADSSAPAVAASNPSPAAPQSNAAAGVASTIAPVAAVTPPAASPPPKAAEEVETIVPSSNPRTKAAATEPVPVAKEAREAPKAPDEAAISQNQAGQAWVRQMPAGTFLVQHTIVPSYAEANTWLQAHPNLRRARIVANYLPNLPTLQYSVVSGPFSSLGDASAYADSPGVPKDPQIRSARFMKEQFSQDNVVGATQRRGENKR